MVNLRNRSYQPELLDQPGIPSDAIKRNMQELNFINTWLGGHAITIKGLKTFTTTQQPITVCEIGCGGGDNLSAIHAWCAKKNIPVAFTGIDINPFCIAVARQQLQHTDTSFITADYKIVQFNTSPDIIFSSLFCHHFTENELVNQLQWMQSNARVGFFINDLHRHPLAYYSIKWLTALFSKSYLVKNDAPLSVARGLTRKEWIQLLKKAGIAHYSIQWKWAFRWLIVVKN